MSELDETLKEKLKELEDKIESKTGIDLPTAAYGIALVIVADFVFSGIVNVLHIVF